MIKYGIVEVIGGVANAVSFLNNTQPSMDVVAIQPGFLRTAIVYRQVLPDDNYPGFSNGLDSMHFPNGQMTP